MTAAFAQDITVLRSFHFIDSKEVGHQCFTCRNPVNVYGRRNRKVFDVHVSKGRTIQIVQLCSFFSGWGAKCREVFAWLPSIKVTAILNLYRLATLFLAWDVVQSLTTFFCIVQSSTPGRRDRKLRLSCHSVLSWTCASSSGFSAQDKVQAFGIPPCAA